jgi:hypothetical protein
VAANDSSDIPPDPTLKNPSQPPDIGKNGENLPEELQQTLLDLLKRFEDQNRYARFEEIRLLERRHQFFKGNQNIFWDAVDKRWKPISSTGGVNLRIEENEELTRYDFVTNIYGANCLIDMATMCQNPPSFSYFPKDPTQDKDLATARAAKQVAEFIADNNRLDLKQVDMAWLWYNDGGCASFTRWEENGQKYGFTQVPITQPAPGKLTPDTSNCPTCGNSQEVQEGAPPPSSCPNCGSQLGPADVQPGQVGMVPKVVGVNQQANGQERINYISFLEVERPFWASSQDEFHWLKWETEVPRAKLRALYPLYESKIDIIDSGQSDYAGQGGRFTRLSLSSTSYGRILSQGTEESLVTLKRVWLRPYAFYELEDKGKRQQFLDLFPNGCYFACTTEQYLEGRDENLDECWVVGHAMPGDGQVRQSLGEWMVDVQRRINAEENIQTETYERGIPSRFMDADVFDLDAYQKSGSLPGVTLAATPKPGQSVGDAVYDTAPGAVSPQMIAHGEAMRGEISQFLTANQPGIFGGSTGSNRTARGISIVKDAALGVKALLKIPMNDFHARTMQNAIKCFQKNRSGDTATLVEGRDGQLDQKIISLDELSGNILVRSEVNASYPMSVSQKRDLVTQIMNNPQMAQELGLMTPGGVVVLRDLLGITDFEPPDYNARTKQARETRLMLEGTAVPVDPIMDDHTAHISEIQDWWESNEGQEALITNQQGIQLVKQHMLDHLNAKNEQAVQAGNTMMNQPGAAPAQGQDQGQGQQQQGAPGPAAPPQGPPVQ